MTREELKDHCKRQVRMFEQLEKLTAVTPNDWKRYEEHKLVLELLAHESILDEVRAEIEKRIDNSVFMAERIQEILQSPDLWPEDDFQDGYYTCLSDVRDSIQQKIDALKGDEE